LCDEKLGRVASAVKRFSEARARAREQGLTEHIRAAEEHIRALEPSVPHLAITLSERLPETRVVIDDAIITPDALASVAVDPGERIIIVSAPDRLPYRIKLVFERSEHKDVTVPPLATRDRHDHDVRRRPRRRHRPRDRTLREPPL
jgi:leucyl-tRNA synthetase